MDCVLALDIGGTKLSSAIVASDGTLAHAVTGPTTGADAAELFAHLAALADRTLAGHADQGGSRPHRIGVGCGGPMSAGGELVSPLNIPQWRAYPLAATLADRYELPVCVDNDAKALAVGEGWLGAARGARDYLAMVVSTGIGAGLVVDGRLLDGASGNAGHLGHVTVEPDGRRCACGAWGCLEAEASGTAIAARTGRPAAEADVAERERAGRLVGRAVAAAVVTCDLRRACVAGSVALGFGEPFFAAANTELQARAQLSFADGARIVPAGLGARGPLVGAGALAWREAGHPALVR